jgi:hypothetical protein
VVGEATREAEHLGAGLTWYHARSPRPALTSRRGRGCAPLSVRLVLPRCGRGGWDPGLGGLALVLAAAPVGVGVHVLCRPPRSGPTGVT